MNTMQGMSSNRANKINEKTVYVRHGFIVSPAGRLYAMELMGVTFSFQRRTADHSKFVDRNRAQSNPFVMIGFSETLMDWALNPSFPCPPFQVIVPNLLGHEIEVYAWSAQPALWDFSVQ